MINPAWPGFVRLMCFGIVLLPTTGLYTWVLNTESTSTKSGDKSKGRSAEAQPEKEDALDLSESGGDTTEELLNTLYEELRAMAAGKMARELPGQTLQATALVHEAWMRLGNQNFKNRAHFFGSAAEAMRRILVESARRRGRKKRGEGVKRSDYEESQIQAPIADDQLLHVHEVLDKLEEEDSSKALVAKLRFFAGLTYPEIASLLGMNEKTARRHWQVAKIRIYQLIKEE